MAKKNKKIIIDDTELKPTVLGEVTGLKRNPFLLIIIFVILMSVIYFIPEINNLLNKDKEESTYTPDIIIDEEKPVVSEEEEDIEDEKHAFTENSIITNDLFKIFDISLEGGMLTYKIEGLSSVNLNNHNYFLEIYNDNTLIKRIMLEKERLYKGYSSSYTISVNTNKIDYFKLRDIPKSQYPPVALEKDVDNKSQMTCIDMFRVTYHFEDDKLYYIEESLGQTTRDVYDDRDGITVEGGFIKYDLNVLKDFNKLPNYIYPKNESPSVIKFEMETNNYKCE